MLVYKTKNYLLKVVLSFVCNYFTTNQSLIKLPPMFIFLMSLSYVIDEIVETRIEYNVFSVYSVI